MASSWVIDAGDAPDSKPKRRTCRKVSPISFIEALRQKYCEQYEIKTSGVEIVFHGKPKSDGIAELDYLRNVVLCNSNISRSGLQNQSLQSLCPNVVDLDLSGNPLESWAEVLPVVSQLTNLKFLNLSDNRLHNAVGYLQDWDGSLPAIENLVLNRTNMAWQDVLCLTRMLGSLKELHLCGNEYSEVPDSGLEGLETVECLRLNGNQLQSWSAVWNLRHLSGLKSLILSGNPLLDVFFHTKSPADTCGCTQADSFREDSTQQQARDKENLENDKVVHENETERDITDSEKMETEETDRVLDNNTNKTNLNETKNQASEPQRVCDSAERLEATNDNSQNVEGDQNGNETRNDLNDQNMTDQGFGTLDTNTETEHTELSDDRMEEDESIEAWCKQIICNNIANIIQEEAAETKSNHSQCQAEQIMKDSTQADIENDNARCPPIFTMAQIGTSLMCGDRGDPLQISSANCDSAETSKAEDPIKGGNSEAETLKGSNSTCTCGQSKAKPPFVSLETLCLSQTDLGKWKHLTAVSQFPNLKALRVKDVKLGSSLNQEDRRKLFVACLPNINRLNGSEVTETEREKSERHLLRHFCEKKHKPDIYHKLEKKHGRLEPLVDVDLSRGYKEWVTLTFVHRGQVMFDAKVCVRQPVGKLRILITERMSLYASTKIIQMYHRFSSPYHVAPLPGEEPRELEQLVTDSLPMSRFDIMDEDEIHFDVEEQYVGGAFKYTCLRNYLPRQMSQLKPPDK